MNRLGFNSSHWNCQLSHFTFRQLHLKTFRVSDFKYRSFTSRLTWACHLGVYSCKPIWWSKSARVAHEESDFRKFDWILSKSIFRSQSHPAGFILRLNSMSCPYIRFITLWAIVYGQVYVLLSRNILRISILHHLDYLYLSLKNTTTLGYLLRIIYSHIWTGADY